VIEKASMFLANEINRNGRGERKRERKQNYISKCQKTRPKLILSFTKKLALAGSMFE